MATQRLRQHNERNITKCNGGRAQGPPLQNNNIIMKTIKIFLLLLLASTSASAQKYAGGDISMLPKYEEAGAKYYTHDGKGISDVLTFFKDEGMNAMRVRLFVDPKKQTTDNGKWTTDENVCQDLDWVKALGKRIKDKGLKFMLDFHYSDTWADPGKQWTPAAWASLDDNALAQKLYSYTKDALAQLKAAGAEPDMIQTGNEISYGMMQGQPGGTLKQCWPSSPDDNWTRFTNLLKQATKACREECPDAKIILHVERTSVSQQNDNKNYAALSNFYKKMKEASIDYDIIGLSYYPYFHGAISELEGAIDLLKKDYADKSVMVVEFGYPYAWAVGGTTYDYTKTYPYSDAGQKAITADVVTMLKKHENVNGLFWWWPEYNAKGTNLSGWYNAPLFDSRTGRATSALTELCKFGSSTAGISNPTVNDNAGSDNHYYTLAGQRVSTPSHGVFIHKGRKEVKK